ncbi:MAG TPA: DNA-protecting protein DprA [Bacteroides sp.]|nr:DNA-protecting protein DprA [Bacteroides sp.]
MPPSELQLRIALTMIPDIGPVTAKNLIKNFGSAEAVFSRRPENLMQIRGIGPRLSAAITSSRLLEAAEKEEAFLARHRIRAYYYQDPDYPRGLKECPDSPILLYSRGTDCLNGKRILSVVGTRRATFCGRETCRGLVGGLAAMYEDLVIVSGLAYGIDVAAHRAALENGLPTVAVLGHGLDTIYPRTHRETAKKICSQGALVTDFPSGTGPERNNFLRRNRIIAGLSDATLVVESGETGGALITAGLAHSYERTVMAVPGRISDQRSMGCNNLIRDQVAVMVTSPSDIASCLNWDLETLPQTPSLFSEYTLNPAEKVILQVIRQAPEITPGDISQRTGTPIHTVLSMLVEMELKGWVTIQPGNRYRIRKAPPWDTGSQVDLFKNTV